jgi:xanthine dehydrogenase molybdopterin-binding subunit B
MHLPVRHPHRGRRSRSANESDEIFENVAVDDCGKILSPLLVEGQIHGGIAQGIAQALYEEVVYDENGQLVTASFMDYAMPKPRLHAPRARAGSLARERLTKKFLYRLTSS